MTRQSGIKIGIATLYHGNCNYGGLLQAYALQRVLSRTDGSADVELLTLELPFSRTKLYLSKLRHYPLSRVLNLVKRKMVSSASSHSEAKAFNEHRQAFAVFEESIPHSCLINRSNYRDALSGYDMLVAGSDQVWNPVVWEDCLFFKGIDSDKTRKVSYAASMGCSSLDKSCERYLKNALKDFYAVSLREESGKSIIDAVYDGATVVLDPTLLLTGEEWLDAFAGDELKVEEPYAFVYLVNKEQKHVERSIEACINAGLHCVVVSLDVRNFEKVAQYKGDLVELVYDCSPPSWVQLVQQAQIVLTNSFHGVAFSVNLNRPFWCYSDIAATNEVCREDRRESFLASVGLVDRMLASEREITKRMLSESVDFTHSDQTLIEKRRTSFEYIDVCFDGLLRKG